MIRKIFFPLLKCDSTESNSKKAWAIVALFSLIVTVFIYIEFVFIDGITKSMLYDAVGWFLAVLVRCIELAVFLQFMFILAHKKCSFRYLIAKTHVVMYPLIGIQQIFVKLRHYMPDSHVLNFIQICVTMALLVWVAVNTYLFLMSVWDFKKTAAVAICVLYVVFSWMQILPLFAVVAYSKIAWLLFR